MLSTEQKIERFQAAVERLGLLQPQNATVTTMEQAVDKSRKSVFL